MFELEKEWQTANDGFSAGFSFKEWLANRFFALRAAAQQPLAPDSPYVCLHCGAHISSEHLPWCKSLPQNGGR